MNNADSLSGEIVCLQPTYEPPLLEVWSREGGVVVEEEEELAVLTQVVGVMGVLGREPLPLAVSVKRWGTQNDRVHSINKYTHVS